MAELSREEGRGGGHAATLELRPLSSGEALARPWWRERAAAGPRIIGDEEDNGHAHEEEGRVEGAAGRRRGGRAARQGG